ncbi:hypothetical protein [Micromonospora sp. NBC_01796]|uniref:hypothetical protein n=1 Tax=Micromonospora sp. NBC_01796 TaxID=2975987 RepID=UPI002DDA0083|nr:hypothetical protein [Micromonospora sp. NBC_01796]WSA88631.1 hypothetical protein OIE47_14065 [Micromonospora sp. NBC_01796]
MATKSGARFHPTLPVVLVPVLAMLLGGMAAGCGHAVYRSVGPAALPAPPPPWHTPDTGSAWPSYPLPDQVRPSAPDGWPAPLPPTSVPERSIVPPDMVPPIPSPIEPTASAGGSGGSAPYATRSGPHTTGPGQATDRLPDGYQRSLLYSGLLGLIIAAIGLTMVGRRRRLW